MKTIVASLQVADGRNFILVMDKELKNIFTQKVIEKMWLKANQQKVSFNLKEAVKNHFLKCQDQVKKHMLEAFNTALKIGDKSVYKKYNQLAELFWVAD